MAEIEKEVKLLNVEPKDIMKRMQELGVKPKWKHVQDIYTFDFPAFSENLKIKLKEFSETGDKRGLITMLSEIYPCFSKEEREKIQKLLGGQDLLTYTKEAKDLSELNNKKIKDIISGVSTRLKNGLD